MTDLRQERDGQVPDLIMLQDCEATFGTGQEAWLTENLLPHSHVEAWRGSNHQGIVLCRAKLCSDMQREGYEQQTHTHTHTHTSLHDRVVKKGVSFLRGKVSIITSSDMSDMHVISMNVILPPRRREG